MKKLLKSIQEKWNVLSKKKRYSLLALLLVLILGASVTVSTVLVPSQPSKPNVATKKVSTQKDTKAASTDSKSTEEKKEQKTDEPTATFNSETNTTESSEPQADPVANNVESSQPSVPVEQPKTSSKPQSQPSTPKSEAPKKPVCRTVTEQVNHPAVTHEEPTYETRTETQVIKEAWDEPKYRSYWILLADKSKTKFYDENEMADYNYEHFDGGSRYSTYDEIYDYIHHPAETQQVEVQVQTGTHTVVDQEAWTETITKEVCE